LGEVGNSFYQNEIPVAEGSNVEPVKMPVEQKAMSGNPIGYLLLKFLGARRVY